MAVMKTTNNHNPSPPTMIIKEVVEEQPSSMKQGIVTILPTDPPTVKSTSSIRRTLSADMSSKNWLAQNVPRSAPNQGRDEVWRSIQSQKKDISDQSPGGNKPPCYVPPLTKRSPRALLTTKSLEICTERLGSETGSDSIPSSYSAAPRQETERVNVQAGGGEEGLVKGSIFGEELSVVKYKSVPVRPFPPPIHSIISDGDSLHVRPRREEGRLVLEAVSVPPKIYFHAHRSDGRLVLTVIHRRKASDTVLDGGESKEEGGFKQELGSFLPPSKSSVAMETAFVSPGNKRNLSWACNKTAEIIEEEEREQLQISKSLPAPASSWMMKAQQQPSLYDGYFWGKKSRGGFINPVIAHKAKNARLKRDDSNENVYVAKGYMNEDDVVVVTTTTKMARGGKVESFVSYLKGCKEQKRSALTWGNYCIATS